MKSLLFVGAHPDDIEYGCGGLCVKRQRLNDNLYSGIHWLVLTHGECGGDKATRIAEQVDAAEFVGVQSMLRGGFEDTKVGPVQDVAFIIEGALRVTEAQELYLPFPQDTHQDHRILTEAGLIAGRWIESILFYESYGTYGFQPDVFDELSEDDVAGKVQLLSFHKSQIEKTRGHFDMIEATKATARFRGFQARTSWAEAYKAFRFVRE